MKGLAVLVIFVIVVNNTLAVDPNLDIVCFGTNNGLTVSVNNEDHYHQLRERYTNCTYVVGNLEITWLRNSTFDLRFLENIREVTGYVLISHVYVAKVILPNLLIIRGKQLFTPDTSDDQFGLFVAMSKMINLEMPALKEIMNGSVGFYNNENLCHVKTIHWDTLITGVGGKYSYVYNFTTPERKCPACDRACDRGCWGVGVKNCQRFFKDLCASSCWQTQRCYGPYPVHCCHLNCAGGCTGPKASDCLACKYTENDGECVSACPPGKHDYLGNCVDSYQPIVKAENAICLSNSTYTCPKICPIKSHAVIVNSDNIESFEGCTVIQGSLTITGMTFGGYQHVYSNFSFGPRIEPMHPDKLEVFRSVKEIKGHLSIDDGYHQHFKNLSYFRNLEIIGGNSLFNKLSSLYIMRSSLTSLGLVSLKKIANGSITIAHNPHLCYTSTINWKGISADYGNMISENKNENDCIKDNLVCHEECSTGGCWGPGPAQCVTCKNVILDGACAKHCNIPRVYHIGYHECKRCPEENHYFDTVTSDCGECDPQCQGCHGPGPNNCIKCRKFKLFENANVEKNQPGSFTCVDECPTVPKFLKHLLNEFCFDESVADAVEEYPKPNNADDFIFVNTKAIHNFKPNHDESNGACKGSDPQSCKACQYARQSLLDFLNPFSKYRKIRFD